jgi:hypothetical protein
VDVSLRPVPGVRQDRDLQNSEHPLPAQGPERNHYRSFHQRIGHQEWLSSTVFSHKAMKRVRQRRLGHRGHCRAAFRIVTCSIFTQLIWPVSSVAETAGQKIDAIKPKVAAQSVDKIKGDGCEGPKQKVVDYANHSARSPRATGVGILRAWLTSRRGGCPVQ